jgi:hypothetical protein
VRRGRPSAAVDGGRTLHALLVVPTPVPLPAGLDEAERPERDWARVRDGAQSAYELIGADAAETSEHVATMSRTAGPALSSRTA